MRCPSHLRWFSRPPHFSDHRIHPGLRHPSRLFTAPTPFLRSRDPYPDGQIKLVFNRFQVHSQVHMMLIDNMNIFSRQLPNMGTAYIARLVFDVGGLSVIILHNGRAAGAICSKVFRKEAFLEIVFCAVESQYQSRGFARLMMNYLKLYLQSFEIFDILTCADNEAVTYFRKQGFNKHEILMDPHRWVGCIKDYDGVTLVHCRIRADVDYVRFAAVLQEQREFVRKRTGIGMRPAMERLKPPLVPFKGCPVFVNISIPELLEEYQPLAQGTRKPTGKNYYDEYMSRMEALRDRLLELLDVLKSEARFASVFGRPVTEEIADGYFEKIHHPMDFWTIEKRLLRYPDYYKRPEVFAADIQLICENCKTFNTPDTPYYRSAVELQKKFREMYEQQFPDAPFW
jgi:histone acetyltransferase